MSYDVLKSVNRNAGCRLCLAPDTECVPIFATAAADKEPLSNKILSCVNIKVSQRAFASAEGERKKKAEYFVTEPLIGAGPTSISLSSERAGRAGGGGTDVGRSSRGRRKASPGRWECGKFLNRK